MTLVYCVSKDSAALQRQFIAVSLAFFIMCDLDKARGVPYQMLSQYLYQLLIYGHLFYLTFTHKHRQLIKISYQFMV